MKEQSPPSAVPWPPLIYIAAAAAAWAMQIILPIPLLHAVSGQFVEHIRTAGLTVFLAGVSTDLLSAFTLWQSRTTIRPDRPATRLVTTGPFRWSRNPIYLGNTVMLVGAALTFGNAWLMGAAGVAVLMVTWLAIMPEEKHLQIYFSEEWADYCRQTRRWFGKVRNDFP